MIYLDEKDELLHAMLDAHEYGEVDVFEVVLNVIEVELRKAQNEYRALRRRFMCRGH